MSCEHELEFRKLGVVAPGRTLALELAGRAEAVLAATARSRGCLDPPPPASLRGLYSALSRLGGLAGGGAAPGLHAFLQATAVPATAPPAKLE